MNNLTKALMEELTVEYVKVGPLQIPESVVISWVILAIVTIGSILLTRNLKVDHISKRQAVLEMAYLAGTNFFEGLLGEKGRRYVPYILEIAIRPTSLCMRLFGNVLGAFVIMELIKLVVPVFVPAVFSLYFDLFDGLIQTYVFVFLTSLFMKETMGGED